MSVWGARVLEREARPIAAPTVQAEHLAPAQLRELCGFIHAAASHLLQSGAHDLAEISLRERLVSMNGSLFFRDCGEDCMCGDGNRREEC